MHTISQSKGLIVITGATGWVGQTALHELQKILEPKEFIKRVRAFSSKSGFLKSTAYACNKAIVFPIYDLRHLPEIAKIEEIKAILHTAFLTRDRLQEFGLEDYININKWITSQILIALEVQPKTSIVAISSGAAESMDSDKDFLLKLNLNPYGVLKKQEELLIFERSYSSLVLRLFALSGRFIRNPMRFALGDFILKALKKQPINISASNHILRSYGNAGDITSLALLWLLGANQISSQTIINAVSFETDLIALANLISNMYGLEPVQYSLDKQAVSNHYVAIQKPFLDLMTRYCLQPKSIQLQVLDTAKGLAINN